MYISEWDFSTSLRSGRNDRDGGLPTVIHSKYGHSKKRGNEVPRFFDVLFLLAEEAEEVNEDVNEIQVQGEGAHDGYLLSFVGGPE